MKKSKFSPNQIAQVLKEYEAGKSVEELSREHGINRATFYQWRKRYGVMVASVHKRVRAML
jgi:putative transposase